MRNLGGNDAVPKPLTEDCKEDVIEVKKGI